MLLWLDLETTGLVPTEDHILEVAWTLTHGDLSPILTDVWEYVITTDPLVFDARVNDYVRKMHTDSGLLEAISQTGYSRSYVEAKIVSDLNKALGVIDEPIYLAGASVHFDKAFIDFWMPSLSKMLSHRVYDTSTLKAFFEPLGIQHGVENTGQHRAANDVREVLSVARAYRDHMSYLNNLDELEGMRHDASS